MIIFTKIFAVFLALLVISKAYHDYKKKNDSIIVLLFWTITWILIAYVALKPELFYYFVSKMANENVGLGTFVGIAFISLFYVTYRVYVKANRLERQIRDIVMKVALKDIKDN